MKTIDIESFLSSVEGLKILVIGDVMLDSYVMGKVERISPEAPIPIVSVQSKESRLGGAANVAFNLKSLGAEPIICSVIGQDEAGREFTSILKHHEMQSRYLMESAQRATTVKTRIISNKQQLLRIDEELPIGLNEKIEQNFLLKIIEALRNENPRAIIIQDYDKGVLTPVVIEEVVAMSEKLQIPVLVDPKRKNFFRYKKVSFFKPNLKELKEGLKIDHWNDELSSLHHHCLRFMKEQKIENMVVTLSERGIFACNKTEHYYFPAQPVSIADVSGAGDTVIALLALASIQKMELTEATQIANVAGSLVCTRPGVVPINPIDLVNHWKK